MDVATPTADCLCLIRDLLSPVLLKGNALSNQEVFMNISERILLIVVFVYGYMLIFASCIHM